MDTGSTGWTNVEGNGMRRRAARSAIGLGLLAAANIVVFATEMLAFLWPVMLMVDAGSMAGFGRRWPRRRSTTV